MMNKQILFLLLFTLLAVSCSDEKLSTDSVVDSYRGQHEETELDTWIYRHITKPYNIAVEYRWDRNYAQAESYTYPPKSDKVKAVLETIKYLWLETYTQPNIGGPDFMKGKAPIRIYMFGGKNLDANGVELICNANAAATEMYIYNVNTFDPADSEKIFILMRSVHHQFAKRLMDIFPYNRDAFMTISQRRYTFASDVIASAIRNTLDPHERFGLNDYASNNAFFTFHSFFSPTDDFAEIISSIITNTPADIKKAELNAKKPYSYEENEDEEIKNQYKKEAEQAYKEFVEKKMFVEQYFEKNVGIKLSRLQLVSLKRMGDFVKKNNKSKD
uniref:Zinc-binding metallopeptidase n=1 Tax=Prevotella sp. GTC17254 TaxID=3236794 RepID=A0AB33J4I7_9BACT